MHWNWIFFRVTGKKTAAFLNKWRKRMDDAHDAFLAFSARVGGDTEKYGSYETSLGWTEPSVYFEDTPDRSLWKQLSKKDNRFWVPKATKAAKEIREEFERLKKLFPGKQEIAAFIGFEMFHDGYVCKPLFSMTDGKYWYISTPEYYSAPKGSGLTRISDLAYDKVAEKAKEAAAA